VLISSLTLPRLIQVLEGADETQSALPQSVEMKYNAFIVTLKVCIDFCLFGQTSYTSFQTLRPLLPGSYVDLMKQAGRIRRPFQAQAFALVNLCRFLADKFNAIENSLVTIENVNTLEE
jgi:hypothetical protein